MNIKLEKLVKPFGVRFRAYVVPDKKTDPIYTSEKDYRCQFKAAEAAINSYFRAIKKTKSLQKT